MKNSIKTIICLIPALCLCSNFAFATTWKGVQGDVVGVETTYAGDKLELTCFGKNWPLKSVGHGVWRGWIVIDLKKKQGKYNIMLKSAKDSVANDFLKVSKGSFRISHIEVAKKMAVFDKQTLARIRAEVKTLKATYVERVDANPDVKMSGRPFEGIVSTPFGAQRFVNGEPRSPHSGIDIAAPAGTVIETPLAGRVLLVADMYLNGKTVAIGHGNGLVSVYSHMHSTAVTRGDWLETRQKIGEVGATGRATGPHLHWGVRFNNARINPDSLL
ncbi:MAG: M23 family metallopeptidase [Mariprofundus sp.]|nr:M23 family metallopeptidase [Mariprofundus sp.]